MLRTKARFDETESQRESAHREIVYRAALEGIVLLENDGALPIAPGRIALYGAGAGRTIKGGTGSGEVNERHSVSILEGLEQAGFNIGTRAWLDDYEQAFAAGVRAHAERIRRQIGFFNLAALARIMNETFLYPYGRAITDQDVADSDTDTCIYVLARQSGEGADRRLDQCAFFLSPEERQNLETCARAYRRTIVVLNAGSTFDLRFIESITGINALLYYGQLGSTGGTAFAAILTGRASPSGKLADTWARRYADTPFAARFSYLKKDLADEDYHEDIYVGYRYFDTFGVTPAYPFGFGLGYSTFAIECRSAVVDGTWLLVQAQVRNTGDRFSGKEVVQIYASCPQSAAGKEYQRLVAFAKSDELQPGGVQMLELAVDLAACASFCEASARQVLDPGDYVFRVGHSSRSTVPAVIVHLDGEVVISQHAHICPLQRDFERLKPVPKPGAAGTAPEDLSGAIRLVARAADFETVVHAYDTPPVYSDPLVDDLMSRLTLRDQVRLVVGSGMLDVLFSRNYINCPGAVGNTTSRLVRKGIINITFADGPAGLRLQKRSAVSRSGRIRMVDAQIDFFNHLPKLFRRLIFGRADRGRLLYQFTTALPVGLSLAQTWNLPLMDEIGRLVGREMHEYGITYWLAPALNTHRNPLCGRNFEYFSEDPLLSGRMAAAITRGCQSQGGIYVAVKHFCANNQEDNRNQVSSNVSERALREIYLRGFEIAVREGGARSVMTSYNRVNGVYTANSHDLCTKVLRNEWGFDGVVMTDWVSTGRRLGNSGLCMKAGNDLVMPGSWYDRRQILAELRAGRISAVDIRRCAANVLRSIVHSRLAAEYPLFACDRPDQNPERNQS